MNLPHWLADWLGNPSFLLSLLSGAVGAVWALSEVMGEFKTETPRALRTAGAWLLVAVNFLAAAVIFRLTVELVPNARGWPTALFIGFAWPTVFRNLSLKLTQPISATDSEAPAIRLEQAYSNVQRLALQLINSVLTRQRMRLLNRVMQFNLADLERYARRMSAISPQQINQEFIDKVMQRPVDDDAKKAHLVALLMDNFTRDAIDDFLKENRNRELRS